MSVRQGRCRSYAVYLECGSGWYRQVISLFEETRDEVLAKNGSSISMHRITLFVLFEVVRDLRAALSLSAIHMAVGRLLGKKVYVACVIPAGELSYSFFPIVLSTFQVARPRVVAVDEAKKVHI